MSDKVKWAGLGAASQPEPLIDHYVTAKVDVNGSTHLGQVIEGVCFAICNYAQNPILLPVADGEVECVQCKRIMKHNHLSINMTVRLA